MIKCIWFILNYKVFFVLWNFCLRYQYKINKVYFYDNVYKFVFGVVGFFYRYFQFFKVIFDQCNVRKEEILENFIKIKEYFYKDD